MQKLFSSENIYIAQSKIIPTERGIFAKMDIKKDTIIETCPIITISADDTAEINEISLISYMYYFGEKKEKALIALGFGSIYNHHPKNNAVYNIKPKENVIEFVAAKDIRKDEEICVNYAPDDNKNTPLWFEE